ncbi:MAG: molybdopterin-dependent oxidoreductase [Phycisphaeraceae bacterium]
MPRIKINGKSCHFEGRKTILQVANENGVEIPQYCYHDGLSVVASCRICLAEVAQPDPRNNNKPTLIPKLMPTCQTPAVDGSEVFTQTDKARDNQKQVMEDLLINHPLDCPVCDQAGECYLQDYSYRYGRGYSRFEEDKIKQPKKDIGPHVLLYSDRCIMCTRCVRFTREITGTSELGVVGRGNREEIDVFPGKPLDNPLSGCVVDLCPVGALLDKEFLFEQRVWFLTSTPSIDGITASGDNLFIDHNEGRVWRVKPRYNAQVNQWWTSDEIRHGWNFVHCDNRLRMPLVKVNGAAMEANWKDAVAATVAKLKGKKIAFMASPMLSCEDAYLLAKTMRGFDAQAALGVGPVPFIGEDQTFRGGYTIHAEKAPNARGVHRALSLAANGGQVHDAASLIQQFKNADVLVITGNYPNCWVPDDLLDAVSGGGKTLILIDTLPVKLAPKADIVLPGATWVEKSGCFENAKNLIQHFDQAIAPLEYSRPEAQIAIDIAAAAGQCAWSNYNVPTTRQQMGEPFATGIQAFNKADYREPEIQFVEI